MLFVILFVMAEVPMRFVSEAMRAAEANDSIVADSVDSVVAAPIVMDTIVKGDAAAKIKRDTTTMDSIELAIYKHNKAVDDSLAKDSI